MKHTFLHPLVLIFALLLVQFPAVVRASTAVLTEHNNLDRTGANLKETILNTSNVNSNRFGLVFTRAVDDQIFAQPLIMTKVDFGSKGRHNVVIVATANDSVYAFDADDPSVNDPYWHVSFLNANAVPPRNSDMTGACGGDYTDFTGNIGIVSTPVIDPRSDTIYLLARTKEYGSNFVQRLHALDLRTGAERPHSPVVITATYNGNGDGSVLGVLTFDPQKANQRTALALVRSVVYLGWSSHCDWGPYHGWFMGYDAKSLKQLAVYNTTPEGGAGGIWMSGQGPAADASGNLYFCVGNGEVGLPGDRHAVINRGESFVKLRRRGSSFEVLSWFTPHDWKHLNNTDADFGCAGPVLIPDTHLAMSSDKGGRMYVVNCDNMGGLTKNTNEDDNIVQSFQVTQPGHTFGAFGSPVWWKGAKGSYAYIWMKEDYLRQYRFNTRAGRFEFPEFARGPAGKAKMPGGILAVSAHGSKAGTGILWATHSVHCDANHVSCPGILEAYNAEDVSQEIWNSDENSDRDAVGNFAKFVPPTIANGKVYLATFSNRLNVYGLLPKK